jgi:uncharacterized protein
MRSNVTFKSNGLNIAGHLYLQDDYKKNEKRPAIMVSHPCGWVKEQTTGLYAKKLREKGFIPLALMQVIRVKAKESPDTSKIRLPWQKT